MPFPNADVLLFYESEIKRSVTPEVSAVPER